LALLVCRRLELLVRFREFPLPEAIAGATTVMRRQGFLRVKEAAELLDVSPNTVRAWGATGKILEYRHPVNNYRLYKRSDLQKLLARVRHPGNAGLRGADLHS
jgi:DNA (cytosine-5)-methyltransferase 1